MKININRIFTIAAVGLFSVVASALPTSAREANRLPDKGPNPDYTAWLARSGSSPCGAMIERKSP